MKILQSIELDNNKIINKTKIGEKLQKSIKKLVPYMLKKHSCDFMNGGCVILTEVLSEIYTEQKISNKSYVVGREDNLDHIILSIKDKKYGEIFIDADGMATKEEMIDKMIFLEQLPNDIICIPLEEALKNRNIDKLPQSYGIIENKEQIKLTKKKLKKELTKLFQKKGNYNVK
jgi:hypothetical protein